jgi:thiol-disulfide isomerase/thioredoxin
MVTRWWALAVALALLGRAQGQEDVVVKGTVVDGAGQPATGIEIATMWDGSPMGMKPFSNDRTDDQGRYELTIPGWMSEAAILAFDAEQKQGAVVTIKPKETLSVPPLKLAPASKVFGRFASQELGQPLTWTNVYINTAPRARLIQCMSDEAQFAFVLPPGKYQLHGYGTDVKGHNREIEVLEGGTDLDLGTIELAATEIAKHVGKAPPPWFVKEARGLKKDVTLADFKGKWVLLDFWGHWCGPCVRQMGELISLYESHAGHRDQFEIIAFHDSSVSTLAEMDRNLVKTKDTIWEGRDLPFPVLLDDERKTATAYGIQSWPTSVLIDPDGKVVGKVHHKELEAKLPKLPPEVMYARTLNSKYALGVEAESLEELTAFLARVAHVSIRLDEPALKAHNVDPKKPIPLTISALLSLRSWLNLVLAADGLTYRPDGDGLVITAGERNEDSPSQRAAVGRLRELLKEPLDVDSKERTLTQLVQMLEGKTGETFVLDPVGRRAGTLNPAAKVSGLTAEKPLGEALMAALKPLGLALAVRDEVIVIEPMGGGLYSK